jgi:hypothetical protein
MTSRISRGLYLLVTGHSTHILLWEVGKHHGCHEHCYNGGLSLDCPPRKRHVQQSTQRLRTAAMLPQVH